ncbi:MAG: CoA pyrophosphatase [Pseudomonadota bacterium]
MTIPHANWAGLDDFLDRARDRLDPVRGVEHLPEDGDIDFVPAEKITAIRPAGVLAPIIPRPDGPTMLLTLRPDTMPTHAGQVAFPGGKMEPRDADEVDAAVREACEEVGVREDGVELVGRGAPYITATAFRIVPVLGLLPADFEPEPDPDEVAEVFETPLEFLMNPDNHEPRTGHWRGQERRYYAMPHDGHFIWGVTAGIIRALYVRLYGGEAG